ncbi:MAG: hypothetical protein KKE11_07175 [Gammaproteobacteria bacterium]|nr:hypothetical protein [Gammaproteobacteria bacterium]
MKTKHTFLLTFIFSLCVCLLNGSAAAYSLRCDEVELYCGYEGMYRNVDEANEEFNMLSEPARRPNFQEMFIVVSYIFNCAQKNAGCMRALKNPDCNVSKYTKRLIKFYEDDNRKAITNEDVVEAFEDFKKGEGKELFSEISE